MAGSALIRGLPAGATLAVVAPAGPPKDGRLAAVPGLIEAQGWRCRLMPGCFGPTHLSFLAADDATRLADLHAAFAAPEVDAVLALRGGAGCLRLLPGLDMGLLRASGKLLIGYSDLTALHAVLPMGLHAPMPASDWLLPGAEAQADAAALFARLKSGWQVGDEVGQAAPHPLTRGGPAQGRLVGGNLAVFCALLGTPWMPDVDGALLFIEDISEEPYRVDRLLTQLTLAGVMGRIAGLVLGSFTGAEPPDTVLADQLAGFGKPVLAGWPAGHGQPNRPLPLGLMAELDAQTGTLTLT